MKNISSQKGFTLIELVVVIAIIGLLSSIILASLTTAREKATNAGVKDEAHQVELAFALYNSDNGGYPNPTGIGNTFYCIGSSTCINPVDGSTVYSQLAVNIPDTQSSISPFFSFFTPKVAEANGIVPRPPIGTATTSYPTSGGYLTSFSTLTTPIVYYCTVDQTLCPAADAWIGYPLLQNSQPIYHNVLVSTNTPSS